MREIMFADVSLKEVNEIVEGVWEGCLDMHRALQEAWSEELRSRPKPKSFLDFSNSKIPGLFDLKPPKES